MNRKLAGAALVLMLAVSGCRSGTGDETPALERDDLWAYSDAREAIIASSCPRGAQDSFAMSFQLGVNPVLPGSAQDIADALDGLSFKAGWSLDAPLASFGGLSGLKVLEDGSLLAVSDNGALISIGFDQQSMAPEARATLSFLTDEDGNILEGKERADSEGLDYRGGIAFISFERDHRIEAYAFGVCGANALPVLLARLGDQPPGLGQSIGANAGPEALGLVGDSLYFGLETVVDGQGPIGTVDTSGGVGFLRSLWIDAHRVPLVGLDASGDTVFGLHRAYNPLTRQNTLYIMSRTGKAGWRQRAKLGPPLAVDNFEGIAAMELADGRIRLFIISDDNFSETQRTLLYVFETAKADG